MAETGLAHYRKRKRLTQAVLAKAIGVDEPTMSHLESGVRIPTSEQVDQLVAILEVPPTYLFSKHILAEVAERMHDVAS